MAFSIKQHFTLLLNRCYETTSFLCVWPAWKFLSTKRR